METIKSKKTAYLLFGIFALILTFAVVKKYVLTKAEQNHALKMYWFVPDGFRAEKDIFKIYEWAEAGELPNLKKMIENGSYGYSRPVFPSHTPTNFATLMTGEYPNVHGIADGAMRQNGYPLSIILKGGFSSAAKKVSSIWTHLELENNLVSLLSIPGSTPPELNSGYTIKGRWGGWGADIPAIIFQSSESAEMRKNIGSNKRVFTFGSPLTSFIKDKKPTNWNIKVSSFSPPSEVDLKNWDYPLFGLMYDSTDDKKINYDKIIISSDKKTPIAELSPGEWSDWLPVEIKWRIKDPQNKLIPQKAELESDLSAIQFKSQVKINIIKLGNTDSFRIRFLYNNLNDYITDPSWIAEDMTKKVGPMVDFVDNYPPQLVYFDEDKKTFLEEADLSLDWHKRAVPYMIKELKSNVVIQSIYTPNQMLTSRWWMPYVDPQSPRYSSISEVERKEKWDQVKHMYRKIDDILGEILKNADDGTYVVFSSDHGALPLASEVLLNNLFAKKGWLNFKYDPQSEEYEIDWQNSKVVFLQMDNIYINPQGLGGIYNRPSGPEYEKLRNEVIETLNNLVDPETQRKPIANIWKWEDADKLNLPNDRVGDLIIANMPTYGCVEDMTKGLDVFQKSLKGGYKQAIDNHNPGLLTPFVIMGPGIKHHHQISRTIDHVEQYKLLRKVLSENRSKEFESELSEEVLN